MKDVHYNEANVEYRTDISGWIDKDRRYWGNDEHMARWVSCDTVTCREEGCSNVIPKSSTRCPNCALEKKKESWREAEKKAPSDCDTMYYSELKDVYFDRIEDIKQRSHDEGVSIEDLLIYHCQREQAPQIDIETLYEDITPDGLYESDMINDEIEDLVEQLNRALKNHPVNCFMPTKIALEVTGL